MTTDVLVIGSLNHDIVAGVDVAPGPGETVLAHSLTRTNGGKGGNQAVAAARVGARVRLVSSVGMDAEGDWQVGNLAVWGVDVGGIARQEDLRTSLALIWVTPDGENSIIVTPGAKDRVTPGLVLAETGPAAVVLAQSEVGAAVCDAAAELAQRLAARFVLSCGPVVVPSAATLRRCDPVVVNASEARDLLSQVSSDADVPEPELAQALRYAVGARSVIVTLGARGSLLAAVDLDEVLPAAPAAQVVDTTGAGDTYCGVLAACLARGVSLVEAGATAARAAAEAVGWIGARPSRQPDEGDAR